MPILPTLADLVDWGIQDARSSEFSALSATVVDFDPVTCTITARIAVRRTTSTDDDTYTTETLPDLPNVRVAYMSAAAGSVRFPLAPGDVGILVVLTLDDTKWRLTGEAPSDPPDEGRAHLKVSVFFPVCIADLLTPALAITDGIEIVAATGPIAITSPKVRAYSPDVRLGIDNEGDTADHPIALATLVKNNLDAIATTLGSLTGGGASFGTPYSSTAVAAARVKAR